MTETQQKITRGMTIDDIFRLHPSKAQRLAQELTNTGLNCVGCHASTFETLEAGVLGHGMSDSQVDALVSRLNEILDEEEPAADTITLTERAASKYISILKEEDKQGWGVRFEERAAGCNGFEYVLDYSKVAKPTDQTFVCHGIEIHVPQNMVSRLLGSEIDYVDGIKGSGFKISNPNVRSACGCGTSHGY